MRNTIAASGVILLLAGAGPAVAQTSLDAQRQLALEELRRIETLQRDAAVSAWKANFEPPKLSELATEADVIVVGKVVGNGDYHKDRMRFTFRISQQVKGKLREPMAKNESSIEVTAGNKLAELLRPRDRAWILFLTREGRVQAADRHQADHYQMLEDNTAIIAADHADLQTVKQALAK